VLKKRRHPVCGEVAHAPWKKPSDLDGNPDHDTLGLG